MSSKDSSSFADHLLADCLAEKAMPLTRKDQKKVMIFIFSVFSRYRFSLCFFSAFCFRR